MQPLPRLRSRAAVVLAAVAGVAVGPGLLARTAPLTLWPRTRRAPAVCPLPVAVAVVAVVVTAAPLVAASTSATMAPAGGECWQGCS